VHTSDARLVKIEHQGDDAKHDGKIDDNQGDDAKHDGKIDDNQGDESPPDWSADKRDVDSKSETPAEADTGASKSRISDFDDSCDRSCSPRSRSRTPCSRSRSPRRRRDSRSPRSRSRRSPCRCCSRSRNKRPQSRRNKRPQSQSPPPQPARLLARSTVIGAPGAAAAGPPGAVAGGTKKCICKYGPTECKRGTWCTYAHGKEEIGKPWYELPEGVRFREQCGEWHTTGKCSFDKRCKFVHAETPASPKTEFA